MIYDATLKIVEMRPCYDFSQSVSVFSTKVRKGRLSMVL